MAQVSPNAGRRPIFRAAQRELVEHIKDERVLGFIARRQYGKTTTFARLSVKLMMESPGLTIIFGSVKLMLGREIVHKESAVMREAIAGAIADAELRQKLLKLADSSTGKEFKDELKPDDFTDLFESQRLEFRIWHDRTTYSRTLVIAPRPDTVGWTGYVLLDEVGRLPQFRDTHEAIKPIFASDARLRLLYSTTPPPDDSHFAFELLSPPRGTVFPVNPAGNWYRSNGGILCLRVDAWDAAADHVPLYDDRTGEPLTPEEHRKREHDKDAWDRNYAIKFVTSGSAACGLILIENAQARGSLCGCACWLIDTDEDFDQALAWLAAHVDPQAAIGLGLDLATTTKESSNPTALAVAERHGIETIFRAFLVWKLRDPAAARERIRRVVEAIARRPGGRARRLSVDATSERYWAEDLRRHLGALLPVELVVASEKYDGPGYDKPTNWKTFQGDQLVAELEDNHLTLPPERYVLEDWRLPKKDRGIYVCEPDLDGKHADTFDAAKQSLHALRGTRAGVFSAEAIRASHVPLTKVRRPILPVLRT